MPLWTSLIRFFLLSLCARMDFLSLLTSFVLYFFARDCCSFIRCQSEFMSCCIKKEEDVTMLCNSGLVTQHLRQHQQRVSVLTSLSLGITEPFQSFSCGFLRPKECYKYRRHIIKAPRSFSCRCFFWKAMVPRSGRFFLFCFQSNASFNDLSFRHAHLSI